MTKRMTVLQKIIMNDIKFQYPDWQDWDKKFLAQEISIREWAEKTETKLFTDLRCHTCGKRLNSDVMFANICPDCYAALGAGSMRK